jgi:hypothetical protein
MLLFLAGRFFGERRFLGRWIPEEKRAAATAWIARRGLKVVIFSRFTPGLRLPTYFAAGLLRSRFWAFTGYFFLASALWTPLLVGGTVAFGERTVKSSYLSSPLGMLVLIAAVFSATRLRNWETRRWLVGFLRRKLRWEFWPVWAAYAPLVPYLVYLGIKHRSLTLFTAANPGMFSGGLIGESKSEILSHLSRLPGAIAEFTTIFPDQCPRVDSFPVVLKPDVGERGSGVTIVHSAEELRTRLRTITGTTILQRYISGAEFGIYYVRYPMEPRGRVLYITEKRFPTLTGDGQRTLKQRILGDKRAVCMASAYLSTAKCPIESIPAAGEQIQLVEIGSHCRGAIFLNGSHLITSELTRRIDCISHAHPGFHIGRYDVRAASAEALQRGDFRVIELNGVSAEATHIYDPAITIWQAYRVLGRHWRTAFEIGAINRARGIRPMTVRALLQCARPSRHAPARVAYVA